MLRRFRRRRKKSCPEQTHQGFTLIEILVSLVVASFVVSGLLYLVVELLRIDQRETVLNRTQQDMQRALDYMSDDLREAIYVYSTPATIAANLATTGNALPASAQPVLAFWKVQPLDNDVNDTVNYYQRLSAPGTAACSDGALTGDEVANCQNLLVRHSYYSLVIYYTTEENVGNNWEGTARLYRYELPEYERARILDANDLVPNAEYTGNSLTAAFDAWVPNTAGTTAVERGDVLVDYVAALTQPGFDPLCDIDGDGTADPEYVASPDTVDVSDSFYVCVRPVDSAGADQFLNQDVAIFLKGDANRPGGAGSLALTGVSDRSELPTLQTQVLVRGVVNKDLRQ